MSSGRRLLIVSNRLPVTARFTEGHVGLTPSSGGLATGLQPYHEGQGGLWIGWPGDLSRFSPEESAALGAELRARQMVAVHLTRDHVERYYDGFANRVLWPLFHYLIDRVPVDATGWDAYRRANEAFADAVLAEYRDGDVIWVHDYHLMLLPALLRERLPAARIGFFLHIPFPSSEVFRILPWRSEVLRGLLGADLVGVHTFSYMRHFLASLLHIDGVEADIDSVRSGDREIKVGVFPMGIDAARFAALAEDEQVRAQVAAIREDAGDRQIILGIDRLDYTKGIPRRLHAVERLLERHPAMRDRIRYIQVAVPSRGEVDSYQKFKRQVEENVGRINGACGTLRSTPVHYMHRSVTTTELVALYRSADLMLVTPLRDGMNLVAKEFVASRPDGDGVLVLSEFAGAAAELDGAVVVNPYDVDALATALDRALTMSPGERRARMQRLQRRVFEHDVHAWARSFVACLDQVRPYAPAAAVSRPEPILVALSTAASGRELRLLVDYDAALAPRVGAAEPSAHDADIASLLASLALTTGLRVDVISARPREIIEAALRDLPVALWAEQGSWHRAGPAGPWQPTAPPIPDAFDRLRPIFEQFTSSTPGSVIEVTSASIAWHYRRAHRDFAARQAHELRMLLGDALSNQPFEVVEGRHVIEVRLRGLSKAIVARRLQGQSPDATLLAIAGDDASDRELFKACPPSSVTVAVGTRSAGARFRVGDRREVRQFLRALLASRGAAATVQPGGPAAFDLDRA